jgi:hypothetical membrane protein
MIYFVVGICFVVTGHYKKKKEKTSWSFFVILGIALIVCGVVAELQRHARFFYEGP